MEGEKPAYNRRGTYVSAVMRGAPRRPPSSRVEDRLHRYPYAAPTAAAATAATAAAAAASPATTAAPLRTSASPRSYMSVGGHLRTSLSTSSYSANARIPPNMPKSRYVFKEKTSYGVACCRMYGNKPQILMIQKRYTYAFSAFVHGVYDCNSDRSILSLLNDMTVDEKIILRSVNYTHIWDYVWLTPPPPDSQKYKHLKAKFEAAFSRSGGMRLLDLIAQSTHGTRIWEIPKGRPRKGESEIHCAVREFYEETGIEKNQYQIFPNASRTHSFTDEGVHYVQKYFIAWTHRAIQPRVSLESRVQIEEVSDIKWLSIEELRFIDTNGRLENLVRPIFNYVKKHTFRP